MPILPRNPLMTLFPVSLLVQKSSNLLHFAGCHAYIYDFVWQRHPDSSIYLSLTACGIGGAHKGIILWTSVLLNQVTDLPCHGCLVLVHSPLQASVS